MDINTLISIAAVVVGGAGLGSGARARMKAAQHVATSDVWRGEAEAQKARGDRLEKAVEVLTEEVHSLKGEIQHLTGILRAVAPELAREGE